MRILALGNLYPPAAAGGYERIWSQAMRAALAAGHAVRVLTTAPVPGREVAGTDPDFVFRELRWYWRDHEWWRPSLRERRAIERDNARVLERHLAEHRPDVASVWGMGGMSLSLLERLARAGVPAVGVVADAWMLYGPRVDAGLRPRPPRWQTSARWLFISAALRDAVGVDGELVHPGVDPAAFPPTPPPRSWQWRLACIGRLEPGKGIDTAIAALPLLPGATLTLDGEGSPAHVEDLRELAAELGVSGRVRVQRSASDRVHEAYAAADAILFPVTWPEPWGLVPLEAMSVGRPVVATGTGGSAEYLRDGANCLLHPPADTGALADAVRRLADDPALRARLVEGGRATAGEYTAAAFDAAVLRALDLSCAADEPGRHGDPRP